MQRHSGKKADAVGKRSHVSLLSIVHVAICNYWMIPPSAQIRRKISTIGQNAIKNRSAAKLSIFDIARQSMQKRISMEQHQNGSRSNGDQQQQSCSRTTSPTSLQQEDIDGGTMTHGHTESTLCDKTLSQYTVNSSETDLNCGGSESGPEATGNAKMVMINERNTSSSKATHAIHRKPWLTSMGGG